MKLILLVTLGFFGASIAEGHSWSTHLREELLQDYDSDVPHEGPLTLFHGMSLIQMNLCPHKQQLNVKAWFKMSWQDDRLKWNATEWGVKQLMVPYTKLFIPDIALYTGVGQVALDMMDKLNLAIVYPSGMVLWVPSVSFSSTCDVNFDNYPWSKQNCTMKFGSWTRSKADMNIVPRSPDSGADLEYLQKNVIEVLSNTVKEVERTYPCCADDIYKHLEYNIVFQKKADFHHNKLRTPRDEQNEEDDHNRVPPSAEKHVGRRNKDE